MKLFSKNRLVCTACFSSQQCWPTISSSSLLSIFFCIGYGLYSLSLTFTLHAARGHTSLCCTGADLCSLKCPRVSSFSDATEDVDSDGEAQLIDFLYMSEKCHSKGDKSHTGCDRNTVEMGLHSNSILPPGTLNFLYSNFLMWRL